MKIKKLEWMNEWKKVNEWIMSERWTHYLDLIKKANFNEEFNH